LKLLAIEQRGIFDSGKEKVNTQTAGNARSEFNLNRRLHPLSGTILADSPYL